jgi:hypothetical protein
MDEFPIDGDGLIRIESTRAVGIADRALSRAAQRGKIIWVAPGVYALPLERKPEALHRLRVLAESTQSTDIISHASAAVLHKLPMLAPDLSRLHVTAMSTAQGYRRVRRHRHPGRLCENDMTRIDGVLATTLERTAFDVARTSGHWFAGALAVFDAALRMGADRARIQEYCRAPQAGVGIARAALASANPLSENPGESWGRAQMIGSGLPEPRLQHDIHHNGRFVARPDYDWRDSDGVVRLVGEFDGIGKYIKYLGAGESPEDAIRREKEREGRLQDMGIVVVRWGWRDLRAGRVVARIEAQLRALGLVTPQPDASAAAEDRRDRRSASHRSSGAGNVGGNV